MKLTTTILPLLAFLSLTTSSSIPFSPPDNVNANITALLRRQNGIGSDPRPHHLDGPTEPTMCTPNGHTCNKQVITPEICAEQCQCYTDFGHIQCKPWNKCKGATMEWNCACHSIPLPPKGKCKGNIQPQDLWAVAGTGKWPIKVNAVKAHPTWLGDYS